MSQFYFLLCIQQVQIFLVLRPYPLKKKGMPLINELLHFLTPLIFKIVIGFVLLSYYSFASLTYYFSYTDLYNKIHVEYKLDNPLSCFWVYLINHTYTEQIQPINCHIVFVGIHPRYDISRYLLNYA